MKKLQKASSKIDPHKLNKLKLQVFWALDNLASPKKDRFTVDELSNFLVENVKISANPHAIRMALNTDPKATHTNSMGIKLMGEGKSQLDAQLCSEENILYIEPEKPFTGKKMASKVILSSLKGDICICDPYCGTGLLYMLHQNFQPGVIIRILTTNLIDKPSGAFRAALNDLRRENFNIEVKIYLSSILHDRYLIDENNAWLSGNSFNDLGNKESFIIELGPDVRQSILATFNQRWKSISATV